MKSNKWTTLSSETSLSWIVKQHSPRQQCWKSSSCGPTVSAIPPGWFGELQYQLHWPVATPPQRRRKNKADDNTITECTRHPCTSRAPSGSIFSSWRKYCPKTTITFMMHCLMEIGCWTQELCQFWFQGRHPWTSKEHAQQSKDYNLHGVITWLNAIGQCLSEFIVAGQVSLIPRSKVSFWTPTISSISDINRPRHYRRFHTKVYIKIISFFALKRT